ncbi:MAG TPA: hypothetical protein PK904_13535 [Bacteroidales bacterium]|mgnify:CR=1 FL=1|nr:hypothetical protein [Bacteroidales bacterium]
MKQLNITFDLERNNEIKSLLINTNEVIFNKEYSIENIGSIKLIQPLKTNNLFDSNLVEIVFTISSGVASGIVANWIYSKLKGKTKILRINRIEIELDEEKITKIISEQIEQSE